MTKLTPERLARLIDAEGGVYEALDCGLTEDNLDSSDMVLHNVLAETRIVFEQFEKLSNELQKRLERYRD